MPNLIISVQRDCSVYSRQNDMKSNMSYTYYAGFLSIIVIEFLSSPAFSAAGDNAHRLPYHLGSALGMLIFLGVILVSWWGAHSSYIKRSLAIFLLAAMFLAVSLSVGFMEYLGVLERLRAPRLPTDYLKPAVMRGFGLVFLFTGILLLVIGLKIWKHKGGLLIPVLNSSDLYGRNSRVLHWGSAMLFVFLMPIGMYMSMIPEDIWYRQGYYIVHKSLGGIVLVLVIIRLSWHKRSPTPELARELRDWERKLAKFVHFSLYLLLFFPISGYVLSTYAGKLSHFFVWGFPLLFEPNKELIVPWALLHKLVLPLFCFLILLIHIFAALKHQYSTKTRSTRNRMF